MKYYLFFLSGTFLIFLFFVSPISAATINLVSNQSQLQDTEEYVVSVSLSINVASGSAYYLRGVFYKPGTSNYCGYTWNGTSWFNAPYSSNNGWKNFLPITVENNAWAGQLKAKLDSTDSGCNQSGQYSFKIERFTDTGSGTFDDQSETTVQVTVPTPTPTLAPTPSSPDQIGVQSGQTSTPTPVPTLSIPTKIPFFPLSPTPMVTLSDPLLSPTIDQSDTNASVLGLSLAPSQDPAGQKAIADLQKKSRTNRQIAGLFLVCGVLLLIVCGIVMFRIVKKRPKKDPDEWISKE